MKTFLLAILAVLAISSVAFAQTSTRNMLLTWTDNSNNEEGFNIYRDGVNVGVTKSATYTDTVTGNWGQQFCYEVSAFNHANVDGTGALQESARSNTSCATIPVPTQPAPNAPSGLLMSPISSSSLQLRWRDRSDNEEIFQAEVVGGSKMVMAEFGKDSTMGVVSGLEPRTRYTARVRAINEDGLPSAWSNRDSARTLR